MGLGRDGQVASGLVIQGLVSAHMGFRFYSKGSGEWVQDLVENH